MSEKQTEPKAYYLNVWRDKTVHSVPCNPQTCLEIWDITKERMCYFQNKMDEKSKELYKRGEIKNVKKVSIEFVELAYEEAESENELAAFNWMAGVCSSQILIETNPVSCLVNALFKKQTKW